MVKNSLKQDQEPYNSSQLYNELLAAGLPVESTDSLGNIVMKADATTEQYFQAEIVKSNHVPDWGPPPDVQTLAAFDPEAVRTQIAAAQLNPDLTQALTGLVDAVEAAKNLLIG